MTEFARKDRKRIEHMIEVCTARENPRVIVIISRSAPPRRTEAAQMRDVQIETLVSRGGDLTPSRDGPALTEVTSGTGLFQHISAIQTA
jgi:hypothetical protein